MIIILILKHQTTYLFKVEKILKGGLDSIPSPSVKIQIMGGEVCLRFEGKTLLSDVLPYYLKQTFQPMIWIFTEGDGIKYSLSS